MSGRSWNGVQYHTSNGMVECDFSFVTNNTTNPDVTLFRGCGGETGDNSSGQSRSNSGRSAVASITYTTVGLFLVTLADGYRFVQAASADISDAADDLAARIGAISNEGAGNSTAVTIVVAIRGLATTSGTLTDTTGRRVSIRLALKDSQSGC